MAQPPWNFGHDMGIGYGRKIRQLSLRIIIWQGLYIIWAGS